MPDGVTLSRCREDFDSLESEWNLLLYQSEADPLFCSPLWQRTYWEYLGVSRASELLLLSVRSEERLLGVAPLARQGEEVSFVGGVDVTDYLDFVITPGDERPFFDALLDHLDDERWQRLDLHCLLPSSPTLGILPSLARERGLHVAVHQEEVSPFLDLPATWDGYLAGLRKKDRHELRRKMRRLEQSSEYRYYAVSDPAQLDADLSDFFRLHRLSRPEKEAFMNPQMEGFFRVVASKLQPQGQLLLYFLEVDGQRTAATMSFGRQGEVLLYNSGFDPAYSHLSVGLLLKALCIKDAIESGKHRFDFLRGPEPYKYDLGGQDVPLYNLVIARP